MFLGLMLLATLITQEVQIPDSLSQQLKSFEPSGALYLEDLNMFLVSSDDTTKKDTPLLFLMNDQGQLNEAPLKIKGIAKMTDMESISQDETGVLYVLSSQSLNKNGKNKIERNLLVRVERRGDQLEAKEHIELRPLLIGALSNSNSANLQKMQNDFEEKLDVESHFVRGGHLYLGLKNPQPSPGMAIIVKTNLLDEIFKSEQITVEEWKSLGFAAISGEEDLLSEILPTADGIILTTTTEAGDGRLWKYFEATGKLALLQEFKGLKSEGLAYRASTQDLLITFDLGEDPARFAIGKF